MAEKEIVKQYTTFAAIEGMKKNVLIREEKAYHEIDGQLYYVHSILRRPEFAELRMVDESGEIRLCRWEMFKGMVQSEVPKIQFSLMSAFHYVIDKEKE